MSPEEDDGAGPFPDCDRRFVLAAWRASQEAPSGGADEVRGHQRRLFSLLTAMVRARLRCPEATDIDGGLQRLATQAMRFAMCDPEDAGRIRAVARRLADRALPLLRRSDDESPRRPPRPAATLLRVGNVIRIDFGKRRNCP